MRSRRRTDLAAAIERVREQITDAHELVDIERAQEILAARRNTALTLKAHDLQMASFAVTHDPACQAFVEFHKMRNRIERGGYHAVRAELGYVPE